MEKEFKLRHENYAGDLDFSGTIRTVPENYYVCDVKKNGELEFKGLEVITRDINKDSVREWWNRKRLAK